MRLSTVLLRQLAVIAYGVIYFLLASSMEAENVQQGYPLAYVLPSMLAQTFVVCGIFLLRSTRAASLPEFGNGSFRCLSQSSPPEWSLT